MVDQENVELPVGMNFSQLFQHVEEIRGVATLDQKHSLNGHGSALW